MLPVHRAASVSRSTLTAALFAARVGLLRLRRRSAARRPPRGIGGRLVRDPVFILCSVRSGSTLLRVILNSHSRIHAPHEPHFNDLEVGVRTAYARTSLDAFGVSVPDLRMILWDRLLYGSLAASGKEVIVDKTPQNVSDWARISAAWPHARFIHLRRHPAAILHSRMDAQPGLSLDGHLDRLRYYVDQLDAARAALPGPTVRYEDLVARPADVTRTVCTYLGLRWEPTMVDYRVPPKRELRSGLGDRSATLRSGSITAVRELPDVVPPQLDDLIARWDYA